MKTSVLALVRHGVMSGFKSVMRFQADIELPAEVAGAAGPLSLAAGPLLAQGEHR
jgi:hypothetical protein